MGQVIYPRWRPFLVPGQALYPRWSLSQFHLSQLVPQSGSTRPRSFARARGFHTLNPRIEEFHFEDLQISRLYSVLFGKETVKMFSTNVLIQVNRIMPVYGLSRTVVPHLLQANSRPTSLGPPQALACGPHFRQGFHYYSLIMIIGP